jgi:hypothetical protein
MVDLGSWERPGTNPRSTDHPAELPQAQRVECSDPSQVGALRGDGLVKLPSKPYSVM